MSSHLVHGDHEIVVDLLTHDGVVLVIRMRAYEVPDECSCGVETSVCPPLHKLQVSFDLIQLLGLHIECVQERVDEAKKTRESITLGKIKCQYEMQGNHRRSHLAIDDLVQ